MIVDGHELVPFPAFPFLPSDPGPGDRIFPGDLHNLKFYGNWEAFLRGRNRVK